MREVFSSTVDDLQEVFLRLQEEEIVLPEDASGEEVRLVRALEEVFREALAQTLEETAVGTPDEVFAEFAVINFIIKAHRRGYATETIGAFVNFLKG